MTPAEKKVEYYFVALREQLKEKALAEAVVDLNYLYRKEIGTWALLKGSLDKRGLKPQQRLLLDVLFEASTADTLAKAAARLKEFPLW